VYKLSPKNQGIYTQEVMNLSGYGEMLDSLSNFFDDEEKNLEEESLIEISAEDLADSRYLGGYVGKTVIVTGLLLSRELSGDSNEIVDVTIMGEDNMFAFIKCVFHNDTKARKILEYEQGEPLRIKGTVVDSVNLVKMEECAVID
jgi:hypothetical protein